MNKEILESKLAVLLGTSEEEKSQSFSVFKKNLVEYLNIGEALRIKDLGVFQLSEQLTSTSPDTVKSSGEKNLTLVFSSESEQSSETPIFLNLEVKNHEKDESEFDENVLKIGIGKPLANQSDHSLEGSKSSEEFGSLNDEIMSLLKKSEKLKDFDLWEDHLKAKEPKNILEEDTVLDQIVDSVIEEGLEDEPNLLAEDFVPLDEEEVLDEVMNDTDLINEDEVSSLVDEIEINEPSIKDTFEDFSEENITDIVDDLNSDVDNKSDELEAKFSGSGKEIEEGIIELDLDSDLKEEVELETIESVIEDKALVDLEIEKELKEGNNDLGKPLHENIPKFEGDVEVKYKERKRKRSAIIYVLIAAFLIVGAIGIYYLFFQNPTWLYDEHEVEIKLSQQHEKELEEARIAKLNELESIADSTISEENVENKNVTKSDSKKMVAENVTEKNEEPKIKQPETKNTTTVIKTKPKVDKAVSATKTEDKEVAKNIYYDGYVYNVQVSSWKQKSIAEKEVAKLERKGLPAFLVKLYIPKFDGTWHRVRLGPYSSLDEAKIAQKKLNK